MTEEQKLLDAILRDPADDTVRLVYADWLDEQGGKENADRALYIRSAIESHNTPACGHLGDPVKGCRSCGLDELLQWFSHNPVPGRPNRAWMPDHWLSIAGEKHLTTALYWRRGFVWYIHTALSVGEFIKHAAEFAQFPLEYFRISDKHPQRSITGKYIWEDRGHSGVFGNCVPKKLWDAKILTPSDAYEEALNKFSTVCINYIKAKAAKQKG
jgi:uncharacterized protein (TIGR02996 family)